MGDQLNISRKYVEGNCDLKCAYNFNYTSVSCTAFNSTDAIQIRMELSNELPVLYNKQKYYTTLTYIRYPSVILYNDKISDAELVVLNVSEQGDKNLAIFIPIKISSEVTSATSEITNIIKSVSVSAPSTGENVTIPSFNLQNVIPKKPFFNYNVDNFDCIAFSMLDAIPISSYTFDTLKKNYKFNNN